MGGREVGNKRWSSLSSAELWWRGAEAWTEAEKLPVRVFGSAAVSLDNVVYLTGGEVYHSPEDDERPESGVFKYEEGVWSRAGNMTTT